jgi:hypothetical protein
LEEKRREDTSFLELRRLSIVDYRLWRIFGGARVFMVFPR